MDRAIWATWYDLPAEGEKEYASWLHEAHLPAMLERPGYLWAAHVDNDKSEERGKSIAARLTHTDDASVPTGSGYLTLFGAESVHTFLNPSPAQLAESRGPDEREMLGMRVGVRESVFLEAGRVDGPEAGLRAPGVTPGPRIQMGSFNVSAPRMRSAWAPGTRSFAFPGCAPWRVAWGCGSWFPSAAGPGTPCFTSSPWMRRWRVISRKSWRARPGPAKWWEVSCTRRARPARAGASGRRRTPRRAVPANPPEPRARPRRAAAGRAYFFFTPMPAKILPKRSYSSAMSFLSASPWSGVGVSPIRLSSLL